MIVDTLVKEDVTVVKELANGDVRTTVLVRAKDIANVPVRATATVIVLLPITDRVWLI